MDESMYILTIYRIMHAKYKYIHGSGNKRSYVSSDAQHSDHRATEHLLSHSDSFMNGF